MQTGYISVRHRSKVDDRPAKSRLLKGKCAALCSHMQVVVLARASDISKQPSFHSDIRIYTSVDSPPGRHHHAEPSTQAEFSNRAQIYFRRLGLV